MRRPPQACSSGAALLAGIQGGVGVLPATGDIGYLEAALDVGLDVGVDTLDG